MAYDKLYFAYYNTNGGYCEITIQKESPVNTYTINKAGNDDDTPVTISHRGESKDKWDETIIQGQECIFKFYIPRNDVDDVTVPLLESEYQDWQLVYEVDSSPVFTGWLKPENLYKRYEKAPPYVEIELSATDGLAELKDVEFRDADGKLYSGMYSLAALIKLALRTVNIGLDFVVQVNTYETTGMTDQVNVIDKIYAQAEAFTDVDAKPDERKVLTCWEVIEEILKPFNCKFHQENNNYHIVNYFEKNSNYWTIAWSDLACSAISAQPADNVVDITEYLYKPYIEQQKIHPLASSLLFFTNKDIGGDITGGLDLSDWDNSWNTDHFDDVTWSNSTTPPMYDDGATAIILTSYAYKDNDNYIELASPVYLEINDPYTYITVELTFLVLEEDDYHVGKRLNIQLIRTDTNEAKFPIQFLLVNSSSIQGNIGWKTISTGFDNFNRIWESGYYNVRISVSAIDGGDWTNLKLAIKDVKIPKFTNEGLLEQNQLTSLDVSKVYTQLNVGGYASIELHFILGDSGNTTETGSLQWYDSSYHSTLAWQPYWGSLSDIRIIDLSARNILINRSRYKNFLRATIKDESNILSLHNIVTIEDIDYAFLSFSKNRKTGWIEAELIELIVSLDSIGDSSGLGSSASNELPPNTDDYDDFKEDEGTKQAVITSPIEGAENIRYQQSHGFAIGDVLRFEADSTGWEGIFIKALADTPLHAKAICIVSSVLSDDLFEYMTDGYLLDANDPERWEPGEYYYLSDLVDGGMETSETLTPGQIEQCIGFGTSKGLKVEIDARNIQPVVVLNGLIEGGNVTWLTGYQYAVGYTKYAIQNEIFEITYDTITLDAADGSLDRIDVIAVDNTGDLIKITGTPAANPQKPYVDPQTQIELSYVLVTAGSSEPSGVSGEVVYDENVEWTSDYDGSSGFSVDFDSTTSPISGSKCAEATDIENGDLITFTRGSTINIFDYDTLNFYIKNKSGGNKKNYMILYFKSGSTFVSNSVPIPFDKYITTWQLVSLKISDITFYFDDIDTVYLIWGNTQSEQYDGFYLDRVFLQGGVIQPPTLNDTYVTNLTWTDSTETLTLKQNNGREDIEVNIPLPVGQNITIPSSETRLNLNSADELTFDDSDISTNSNKDWIEFEFRDIEVGTSQTYVLDIKALVAYTIDSVVLQTDDGTIYGVEIQIAGTPIDWGSAEGTSIDATTSIVQTDADSDNSVAVGNKVTLVTAGDSSDAGTAIRGKLNMTRT